MPGLARAQTITERASQVGFDWPDIAPVWGKVEGWRNSERLFIRRQTAHRRGLGDLLFSLVNLSRFLGLQSEEVLAQATERFIKRFSYIETRLHDGKKPDNFVSRNNGPFVGRSQSPPSGAKEQEMNREKIVFLDAATYGDISLQSCIDQWDCTIHQVTTRRNFWGLIGQSVAVTNKVVIDRAVFSSAAAKELKLIAVAATGTDIIDREAAKEFDVRVCNVPGYATQSVAQSTLALILELATRAARYGAAVRSDAWQKSPVFTLLHFPSIELKGKKLGIIGYGDIGQAVAEMARGFGLEVLIAARPGSTEPIPSGRVPLRSYSSKPT